jgi:nitrite reductase (NO-forming)
MHDTNQPAAARPGGQLWPSQPALVWAALSVQAAIMGGRQDSHNARVQQQIDAVRSSAPASAAALPVAGSDQAKTAAFDATLPPASTAPAKELTLTATDDTVIGIAKDINFTGWTFGGTVPAKPLRVRQGDTVKFTLVNQGELGHGMDFHAAAINPGDTFKVVLPGQSFSFEWQAVNPGVFLFHCSAGPVIEHIANGMYGAIIVDPAEGLAPAREFALVQSEFYAANKGGVYTGDLGKMMAQKPDYVVFNGMVNQYLEHPLTVNPGELIRLWVVNAGPSQTSAFHVIGAVFSAVYADGHLANKQTGVSTYTIPAGGAAMFELTIPTAGTYPSVTHSFADASKGAIGVIQVGTPPAGATDGHASGGHAQATGTPVAVAGTDNKFTPAQFTAKVGEATTITFTNRGSAIHNLRIAGMPGPDGKDVQTALLAGGKTGTVTFTLTRAGTYKFICDVHPVEMTGTTTVK